MRGSAKYVKLDMHPATTFATVQESSGKIIVLPTGRTGEEPALVSCGRFFAAVCNVSTMQMERTTWHRAHIPTRRAWSGWSGR